jgi:hypothetical protein
MTYKVSTAMRHDDCDKTFATFDRLSHLARWNVDSTWWHSRALMFSDMKEGKFESSAALHQSKVALLDIKKQ